MSPRMIRTRVGPYALRPYVTLVGPPDSRRHRRPNNSRRPLKHRTLGTSSNLFSGPEEKRRGTSAAPEEDIKCAICLDTQDFGETLKVFCGHSFHRECIETWKNSENKNQCPMCRKPLDEISTCCILKFRYYVGQIDDSGVASIFGSLVETNRRSLP